MKGGDLANQLADAAGGLDKLQAASANYQNFYSAAEQHDIALRQQQAIRSAWRCHADHARRVSPSGRDRLT